MKTLSISALSAAQRALLAGARQAGERPVVTGKFGMRCQACRRSVPVRELVSDPAGALRRVCPHCARLRKPKPRSIQRDETLPKT